jgi:PAS domain-containing protein
MIEMNHAFAQMFGYEREDFFITPLSKFFPVLKIMKSRK